MVQWLLKWSASSYLADVIKESLGIDGGNVVNKVLARV
jgi:hypothetical protein